ncbi:MAG: hypothetical protein IAX21_01985 [Candidatus Bathyarchaeota archaeon]|nr:hypothetical protein [Candidatus Bathyarchaeum tardum]WGM90256.1 MAG: hypothetical protein NUK63_03820 [Candidatus Bathyarchaeum tardum]WNZ29665.1 MAG: hypothetical protein IAX21_01985 [Candidatus Bathyarchaeota archaeon]
MTTLSEEFMKKVAELYQNNRTKLENLDESALEKFASKILELIKKEKKQSSALHDLQILEYNMGKLKNYAEALATYKPDTDEYDFTKNDCKNIVDATKKWLTLENKI